MHNAMNTEDTFFLKLSQNIICIECESQMKYFPVKKRTGIFLCPKCHNVNLVDNNIFVFIPKKYETRKSYQDFLLKYSVFLNTHKEQIGRYLMNKIDSLPIKRLPKWEDQDVLYWDKTYKSEFQVHKKRYLKSTNISGLRTLTREKYLFKHLRKTDYINKYLLEIGCGEAFTIRSLFSPLNYNYNYIATDYSYWALRNVQKTLGNHKNTFYFQCLGHVLPFKNKSLDYILSLGVLHHMPEKEKHLPTLITKLKPGGLIIAYEPYLRKSSMPLFLSRKINKWIEPNKSSHEERIN